MCVCKVRDNAEHCGWMIENREYKHLLCSVLELSKAQGNTRAFSVQGLLYSDVFNKYKISRLEGKILDVIGIFLFKPSCSLNVCHIDLCLEVC